jgi:NAD(P)-dependent dehydrogenase (short-subunit alcohol dehydrogenase family)
MPARILDGKVAIVTGAASGMGAATAGLFAAAGGKVIVSDVDETGGRATVAAIEAAGGTASFVLTDVSASADVDAMVRAAVDRYGRLDCAVNNAAIAPDTHPLAEMDEAEFDRIIAVDLKGVALCLKYEIAQLLAQGDGGSIVNIGSVNSFRPQQTSAAYTAAKHGVIGLTKSASLEYARRGIRVNTVCPGAIDTPMLRSRLDAHGATEADYAPTMSLFNRLGKPEEIAQASLWLCSEHASYVTGVALPVDAGYTSR